MATRKKTPTLLPDLDSIPKFVTLIDREDFVRAICVKFSFAMNNVLSPLINPDIRKIRRPRMMIGDIWEIIRSYIVPPLTHTVTMGMHGESAVADTHRVITFDETSDSSGRSGTALMHVMQKDINCIDDEGNVWDETFLREMGLLDTSTKSIKPDLSVGETADLKIVPFQLPTTDLNLLRYLTGCPKHDIALPAYSSYHMYDLCSINGEHSSISITSDYRTRNYDHQRFGICFNTIYACQYDEKAEIFTVYTHNGSSAIYNNNTNIEYWSINGKPKNHSGYSSYDTDTPRIGLTKTNTFVDFAIGSNVLLVAYHKRVAASKYHLVIYEISVINLQKFAHIVHSSQSIYQEHNFMKIKKVHSLPLDGCLPNIIWSRLFIMSQEDSIMEGFNLAAMAHPTLLEMEQLEQKKSSGWEQICVQLMTSNVEIKPEVNKCECYRCNRSHVNSYNISRQIKCTKNMRRTPLEIPTDAQHCIFIVYTDETFAKHNVPAALETGKLVNYGLMPISLRKQPPRITRTSVTKTVNQPVFAHKSHDDESGDIITDNSSELNWDWDGEFLEDTENDAIGENDTECIIEEDIEILPDIIVTFNTYKNVLLVTK